MGPRRRRLSVFFAAFVAFKVAEAAFGIERWPASNVSMFSGSRPRQFVPLRGRLHARRGGTPVVLTQHDFALTSDEFRARLHPDSGVGRRCGRLVEAYNRRVADPARRLTDATVKVEPVPRPGLWNDVVPWTVACTPGEEPGHAPGKAP